MGKPKGSADARKAYLDKKARKEQARTGGVRRLFRLGGGAAAALAGLSFLYMVLHGALSEHIAEVRGRQCAALTCGGALTLTRRVLECSLSRKMHRSKQR